MQWQVKGCILKLSLSTYCETDSVKQLHEIFESLNVVLTWNGNTSKKNGNRVL